MITHAGPLSPAELAAQPTFTPVERALRCVTAAIGGIEVVRDAMRDATTGAQLVNAPAWITQAGAHVQDARDRVYGTAAWSPLRTAMIELGTLDANVRLVVDADTASFAARRDGAVASAERALAALREGAALLQPR